MLKCVDLFAGAGGFSLAAKRAEFDILLAIENNPHAVETYRENLCNDRKNNPLVIGEDICELDAKQVFEQNFQKTAHCDLLLGGPPCQGFSTHRIKNAGVEDERNKLIFNYFEFVKAFSPTAFLMENVPGMLWDRHKYYVDQLYARGKKAGYFLFEPVTIDAQNFGIPQRRKRVFILGVKEGVKTSALEWPPSNTHGNVSQRSVDPNLLPWKSAAIAFRSANSNDPNNVHMNHSDELVNAFKRTPPNGGSRKDSGRILKCHLEHDGHKDVYGRIDPTLPAPTMTTACINPSKGRFVHPTEHHGITVRQAARLQTFPDEFHFSGGLIAAGQQIGNAVPIDLGQILLEHLKPMLLSHRVASGLNDSRKAA